MAKVYLEKNVLEAALERLEIMFKNFDNIYFSVSGGKDSSAMLYSVNELGFKPLAFTFEIGYNILTDKLKSKIDNICKNIGVKHEYIDMHPYVTEIDRECFPLGSSRFKFGDFDRAFFRHGCSEKDLERFDRRVGFVLEREDYRIRWILGL